MQISQSNVLLNGDFESGDLNGWSITGDVTLVRQSKDALANGHIVTVAEGQFSVRIGNSVPWAVNGESTQSTISQEIIVPVSATGVPPVIQFAYAVVANDPPSHPTEDKPLFSVMVTDKTTGEILYTTDTIYTSQTSGEWYLGQNVGSNLSQQGLGLLGGDRWVFKPWQAVTVDLIGREGHLVQLEFGVRDCNYNAHAAYGYLDSVAVGEQRVIPVPDVTGDPIPAQYIEPSFLQRSVGTLERLGLWPWIMLCCLPLLLLPLLLLLLRRNRSHDIAATPITTTRPRETPAKEPTAPLPSQGGGFRPPQRRESSEDKGGGFRPPD